MKEKIFTTEHTENTERVREILSYSVSFRVFRGHNS